MRPTSAGSVQGQSVPGFSGLGGRKGKLQPFQSPEAAELAGTPSGTLAQKSH